jgi:hypothetical protein
VLHTTEPFLFCRRDHPSVTYQARCRIRVKRIQPENQHENKLPPLVICGDPAQNQFAKFGRLKIETSLGRFPETLLTRLR